MSEIPFATSETDLAVYLIKSGFILLGIQYEPRYNGRQRGIFIFQADSRIAEAKELFESGQAQINLTEIETLKEIKTGLLDRVMRGLP